MCAVVSDATVVYAQGVAASAEKGAAAVPAFAGPKGLNLAQNQDFGADKALSDAAADTNPPPAQAEPQPTDPSANQMLEALPSMEVDEVKAVPPGTEAAESIPAQTVTEAPSGDLKYAERNEDSEIILELVLDDGVTVLDSGIVGYLVDETVLLPLGRFTELLEFPIDVNPGTGAAEGWFVREENTFRLYYPYKSTEIAGKKIPLNRLGIAELHVDDIYVSSDLLTSWFPIELTLNYGELRLYMKTLVDLPFQERAKRRARWEASKPAGQPGVTFDPKELIRLPYSNYSAPAIEVNNSINHARDSNGSDTSTTHSINAEGELLKMDARLNLNYQTATDDRDSLDSVSFNMSKEDFEANLLGPLKATRYELGDVSAGSFPLAGAQQGRGFTVNNEPYNFVRDATNFRIEGFGPVGWDVEIFQDLELIEFAEIGADGRYEFATLPLNEGFNIFKIVLYGPNGEREERYERFYLGQNMVEEGKLIYNASLLQSSTPLFNFGVDQPAETPHTLSVMGEYGISKSISAMGGYYHGPIAQSALDGVGVGVRASGGRAYAQMNAFFDKSGGVSSSALITANLTDTISANMTHRTDIGFPNSYYTTVRRTDVQATKMFDFKSEIIPDIALTASAGREEEDTGREKNTYGMKLSTNFMGLSLTSEHERSVYSDATPDTHDGRLSARYRSPFGTLRGELQYQYMNPFELRSGILSLQTDLTDTFSMTNGIDHSFGDDPTTTFTTSLDWKLDKVRVGLRGSMDNKEQKQIGLNVGYSFVPQTQYGSYMLASRSDDVQSGRLILRPFLDADGNGTFGEGEEVLEGIQFKNVLRGKLSATSKDGQNILSGLSPGLANRIAVEEKTIPDIYMVPVKKEIVVLGKRGLNGPIDVAFSKLGTISGTLTAAGADGEDVIISDARMILIGPDGKEAAEAYSEFDGYYTFDGIPMGEYEIFLPASAPLAPYYSGSGEGPRIRLGTDEPEKTDQNIRIMDNQILLNVTENTVGEGKLLDEVNQLEAGDKQGVLETKPNDISPVQ